MAPADYRGAALMTASLLKPIFTRGGNYWRLGHYFDTIIDYLTVVDGEGARVWGEIALDRYEKSHDSVAGACLYDDYGWWGLAALRATQRPTLFGDLNPEFVKIVDECWQKLGRDARTVWPNPDKRWDPLAPVFPGGVWNCAWSKEGVPGDCATPCDPLATGDKSDGIRGRQNTVTNALCLMLATRLAQQRNQQPYRDAADDVYGFLKSWCNAKAPLTPLLYNLNPHAVVLERVARTKAWGDVAYQPQFAWAGDEGLFLAALLDYCALRGDDGFSLATAKRVLQGIRSYLSGTDKLLQPWAGGHAPAYDDADYLTGVGVCMRCLQYGFQQNDSIKKLMKESDYPNFIRANADEASKYPDLNGSDDDVLIRLSNNLATLVAAVIILA